MAIKKDKVATQEHLRTAFDMYDNDKSGFISASELKSVISDFGVNLNFGDADEEKKIVN